MEEYWPDSYRLTGRPVRFMRDWFAAQAPEYPFALPDIFPGIDKDPVAKTANAIAAWCYAYADAMIAERDK